jgi:hypothetical protein
LWRLEVEQGVPTGFTSNVRSSGATPPSLRMTRSLAVVRYFGLSKALFPKPAAARPGVLLLLDLSGCAPIHRGDLVGGLSWRPRLCLKA